MQSRWGCYDDACLTLLHPERPKLYAILAFLSAVGLKKKKKQKKKNIVLHYQAFHFTPNQESKTPIFGL